jgi:hypothetical protein
MGNSISSTEYILQLTAKIPTLYTLCLQFSKCTIKNILYIFNRPIIKKFPASLDNCAKANCVFKVAKLLHWFNFFSNHGVYIVATREIPVSRRINKKGTLQMVFPMCANYLILHGCINL